MSGGTGRFGRGTAALWRLSVLGVLVACVCLPGAYLPCGWVGRPVARADTERRVHVAVHRAQWAEVSLPKFPMRAVTLDVPMHRAYFAGAAVGVVLWRNFVLPLGLFDLQDNDLELELQGLQHYGLQSHFEVTAALVIRGGEGCVLDALCVAFAFGEGVSRTLSQPAYEKGPGGRRGVGSVRFQNHLMFELEWTVAPLPELHLLTRLHHRSGVYGLISPRRTGSNYLGVGLRYDL